MGKFLKKFKETGEKADSVIKEVDKKGASKKKEKVDEAKFHNDDPAGYDGTYDDSNSEDFKIDETGDISDVGVQPAQKPESFHHFLLENQYQDLECSIRGYKDVYNKETRTWEKKRKDKHCFTDEEAEEILRTAQSHLSTDVKLGWIRKEIFGEYMDALYDDLCFLFESIAEYRYGRYDNFSKDKVFISVDYQAQYDMKLQNQKIFLELWTRVQANYSRSVNGQENKYTHESVKGQESLQSGDRDFTKQRGY